MKKSILLLFVFSEVFFALSNKVLAQAVICPTLTTSNVSLPCTTPCTTLSVTPTVGIAATTSYSLTAVTFAPFPYTGTAWACTIAGDPPTWSSSTDDNYGNAIPLPFSFCFFGNNYNQIVIGTNGVISFNTTFANTYEPYSISGPLPGSNNASTKNAIMGVWEDTYVGGGPITYATYGSAPCRQFVISWDSVDLFLPGTYCTGITLTSQIVLYESSNVIDIYIGNRTPCPAWNNGYAVCGIENNAGTLFYCPSGENGTMFTAANQGWRFVPTGAVSGWTYAWTEPGGATIGTASTVTVCPTATTTYTVTATSSCSGATLSGTSTVTVTSSLASITGATSICTGSTTPLSEATPGGNWSSSNTAVATIVPGTGIVSGITAGISTITYAISSGCFATTTVTVNTLPPAITGVTNICAGAYIALSDTLSGGTWSSAATSVATVTPNTGIVTGVTAGMAIISYTTSSGCAVTVTITVDQTPPAITGSTNVCAGSAITLSDTPAGGSWSSNNTSVATISGTGVLNGLSAGISTISYTTPAGCFATTTITVNAMPPPITGNTTVCVGSTIILSDATTGGTWQSSNTSIATVTGAGIVTGISAGTVFISYSVVGGCFVTIPIAVNTVPSVIAGVSNLCMGAAITLSDTTTGGTWSSSNTTVATVNSGGIVSGIAVGTTTITYSSTGGCFITKTVTVSPVPSAISGTMYVCTGATTILSDAVSGGTWSSATTTNATVSAGVVSGVAAGLAVISYSTGSNCAITATVTVNQSPSAILGTGSVNICTGVAPTLSDAPAGGTWSVSNSSLATITPGGTILGITIGTTSITYTLAGGCFNTATVTINAFPLPIAGTGNVCAGSTITLSDAVEGGVWSSGTSAIATVVPGNGIVTGVAGGNAVITYSTGIECTVNATVTVIPLANAGIITGPSAICVGTTIHLSDTVAGGAWSSSNTSATVSGGIITGISPGTDTIIYSVTNTCNSDTATKVVTMYVFPVTGTITGDTAVCAGSVITLSDTVAGGAWSSSNTSVIISGGIVTGVYAGAVTIDYAVTNVCGTDTATKNIMVYPLPSAGDITGPSVTCVGATINMSDNISGGTWSSGNATAGTIDSITGVMHVLTQGTTIITYSTAANAGGCSSITTYTVTVSDIANFTISSSIGEVSCYGENNGSINIAISNGSGQMLYSWFNSSDTTSFLSGLSAGPYYLMVTDLTTECIANDTFNIMQPDSLYVADTITNDLCHRGTGIISVAVSGGIPPYTYAWSNSGMGSTISGLIAGTYSLTVTDSNNCTKNIFAVVQEDTCSDIIIHDVITPNGDGINDVWVIEGISEYPNNTVAIFDKWGNEVYEKSNYNNTWDGKWKNHEVPDGTYYYLVKLNAKNATGGQDTWTGYLLIKR